jgi:hypothetical protein
MTEASAVAAGIVDESARQRAADRAATDHAERRAPTPTSTSTKSRP